MANIFNFRSIKHFTKIEGLQNTSLRAPLKNDVCVEVLQQILCQKVRSWTVANLLLKIQSIDSWLASITAMAGFLGIGLFKISSENDERNSDGQILFCFSIWTFSPYSSQGRSLWRGRRHLLKAGYFATVGN